MNDRIINLKSLKNLRTLGGMKTKYGKVIGNNKLYRSAALNKLNDKEADFLRSEYHLKRVVDLRTPEEISEKPDRSVTGVENIQIPIVTESMLGISHEKKLSAADILDYIPDLSDMYRLIVSDDICRGNLSRAVKTIMENRDGGVLWHCTVGKDRCGVTSAVILYILGVSEKDILEDYLLTNLASEKQGNRYYWLVRILKRDKKKAEDLRRVFMAETEYLKAGYDTMIEKYGSMEKFITDGLNISEEEQQKFRDYILE